MEQKTPPKGGRPPAEKIFFWVFSTLIIAVVVITFCRYFILKDYDIEAQADCDPTAEKCFVWKCDPESTVEGEKCTGDAETDTWYYKIVTKKAYDIPLCDPNDENCQAYECLSGQNCSEKFCDELNKPKGEECNDPVKYNEENPPEEESEECAPDDQECLDSQSAEGEECAADDQKCLDSQDENNGGADSEITDSSNESGKKINNSNE